MVLNPVTGHVSPKVHVVFDDELSTVSFMREGTIPQSSINLVQRRLQSGSPEYIDLKYTWFNKFIEENTRESISHNLSVAP